MKEARSRNREDWTNMTPGEWMSMTPSDWMSMTPSDWMNMTRSRWMDPQTVSEWWDRTYGDMMRSGPTDWWTTMYGPRGGGSPWPATRTYERGHHHTRDCRCYEPRDKEHHRGTRHHGDCCRRCGSDPCVCACCIGDVDLAIYSRVGEQRVIPIIIENERHRDKEITLELSGWTTRGGKAAPVDTVLLEPKTFKLASCSERKVTLVVKTRDDQPQAGGQPSPASTNVPEGTRGSLPDVDDCLVAFADLRVVGCDHRAIRIAVALLPRDCDPFTVHCGCTCC